MASQTYEITFTGEAGPAAREEFDDCVVTVGSGTTTLRAELPDQSALIGLLLRVAALRFDVIHMWLVEPPNSNLTKMRCTFDVPRRPATKPNV